MRQLLFLWVLGWGLAGVGWGQTGPFRLARPFTSNAVLQRDHVCPVFGVDAPGTAITVHFAGQERHTTAGAAGDWRVELAPLKLSSVPQSLSITGSRQVTCTNLLVGDVWLISGQSNASFPLRSSTGGARASQAATHTLLRCWWMKESPETGPAAWTEAQLAKLTPEDYMTGGWEISAPATVGSISGVGYFFAHHLLTNLNIPIGLIDCTVGGTLALDWMPTDTINAHPQLKSIADQFLESERISPWVKTRLLQNLASWNTAGRPVPMPEHPYKPGACWRNGLANIAPFAMRGILWYQGESDADYGPAFDDDLMAQWYTDVFTQLVASWRGAWEDPELPVYFVQLPQMNRPSWPWFREAQWRCAQTLPHTAMAVAFEHGTPDDVHPPNKQPVGERLALIARALSYGQDIEWSGPQLVGSRVSGSRMVLTFSHATGGLHSSDGEPLKQFRVAGEDRRFYPALGRISGATVIVSAPEVPQPVAVRYCWVPSGPINFYNGAGLPAAPFRTDRWNASDSP
jgi:sialate O-acetylesterase